MSAPRGQISRAVDTLLAFWPLPPVAPANPYHVGVFYSRRADAYRGNRPRPPYVVRAADAKLARLLAEQPLALVKGQSRAGKSRTAFEVAASELGDWRLLVPKDRQALASLRGRFTPLRWLGLIG
jgi:hypothetical protein